MIAASNQEDCNCIENVAQLRFSTEDYFHIELKLRQTAVKAASRHKEET